jgi:hypothetical protein
MADYIKTSLEVSVGDVLLRHEDNLKFAYRVMNAHDDSKGDLIYLHPVYSTPKEVVSSSWTVGTARGLLQKLPVTSFDGAKLERMDQQDYIGWFYIDDDEEFSQIPG